MLSEGRGGEAALSLGAAMPAGGLAIGAARLGSRALDFTKKADDFFEGTHYTGKVKGQMAKGDLHSFPESVKGFQDQGTVRKITGGDGKVREQLEIRGSYYKTHRDGSKT